MKRKMFGSQLSTVIVAVRLTFCCAFLLHTGTHPTVRQPRTSLLPAHKGMGSYAVAEHTLADRFHVAAVTPASDLSSGPRHVTIVTTAALPWMTGTAVNPLLRAGQLAARGHEVVLVLPFMEEDDQAHLFKLGTFFERPSDQESAMREWLDQTSDLDWSTGLPEAGCESRNFNISWYPARYHPNLGCLLFDHRPGKSQAFLNGNSDTATAQKLDPQVAAAMYGHGEGPNSEARNLMACLPEASTDVVILEEPEHLNWYHYGPRWGDRFAHVAGIGHTNYLEYCRSDKKQIGWRLKEPVTRVMTTVVTTAYCDVVVQLSAALHDSGAPLSRTVVSNTHGVRDEFLSIGTDRAALETSGGAEAAGRGVYFLGKKLWAKGYRQLVALLSSSEVADANTAGIFGDTGLRVDLIGSGPDESDIENTWREHAEDTTKGSTAAVARPLVSFLPATDHASQALQKYHVFVNPSTSDVLCTATAEALAMGKTVLIARHPSNEFFYQFANAIPFDPEDANEFVRVLGDVYAKAPLPLTPSERRALSWAAATDRLADAIALPTSSASSAPADTSSSSGSSSQLELLSSPNSSIRPSQTMVATAAYIFHRFLSAGWLGLFLRDATGALPELPDAAAHAAWSLLGASTSSGDTSSSSSSSSSEIGQSEQGTSADRAVVARQAMVTGAGMLGIILSAVTSMESALAENYQPSPCDGSAPLLLAKLHDKAEVWQDKASELRSRKTSYRSAFHERPAMGTSFTEAPPITETESA